jgi:hypothetical protein
MERSSQEALVRAIRVDNSNVIRVAVWICEDLCITDVLTVR